MYYKYVDLHKADNVKKLGTRKKAKALWSMRDAKTNGKPKTTQVVSDKLRIEPPCDERCGRRTWIAALEDALIRMAEGAGNGSIFQGREQ